MIWTGRRFSWRDVSMALVIVMSLIFWSGNGKADQMAASDKPILHEFILVQVAPGKRFEFLDFLKKEYLPLQTEDEHLVGLRYYIEDRGLEWDFIVDLRYRDYAGAGASQKRFGELLKKRFPDEKDQKAFIDRFQGYVVKHQHMFYRDVPSLAKN